MKFEIIISRAAKILRRHRGPDNAIPVRALTREIGLPVTLERTVRRALKLYRAKLWNDHDLPVISGSRGYFLSDDIEQIQRARDVAAALGLQYSAEADAIDRLCKSSGLHIATSNK